MASTMSSLNNISWQRLEKDGAVCYPVDDETSFGNEILFSEGFPTSNGKAKIVPADLMPPDEKPNKKYPFILTTGRLLEHWHTGAMTRRSSMLEAQEPIPTVSMHPNDIRKLGLKRGENVLVETQRGIIEILLREDRDVSKGMLFIPFCFTAKLVFLERTFKFPNSNQTWTGVPIIAANMDTVGTYDVTNV